MASQRNCCNALVIGWHRHVCKQLVVRLVYAFPVLVRLSSLVEGSGLDERPIVLPVWSVFTPVIAFAFPCGCSPENPGKRKTPY